MGDIGRREREGREAGVLNGAEDMGGELLIGAGAPGKKQAGDLWDERYTAGRITGKRKILTLPFRFPLKAIL